jgi:hypothetical protein
MNLIQKTVQLALPPWQKATGSGWISINAPCCHHRGESRDKRKRGGILFKGEGFVWHCFNCGYAAGWQPGKLLNNNTKDLLRWLGIPEDTLGKLIIDAMRIKENLPILDTPSVDSSLVEEQLPLHSGMLIDWLLREPNNQKLINCIEYIYNRGLEIDDYKWHWSPESGYEDRLLIPFYHQGKVVGWTGRKLSNGRPKYLSKSQPSYVFNLDSQGDSHKHVILTEGPFDAIAVNGVAVLGNEVNLAQAQRLKNLNLPIIVVPDRDLPGTKLINAALEHNWRVSIPPWDSHIKDVSDAVKEYGKMYTVWSIINYCETNQLKIKLMKKKLEKQSNDQN